MVLCNLHLISLKEGISIPTFLTTLHSTGITPIVQARVLRWMILPRQISSGYLLARNTHWDLLLILSSASSDSDSDSDSLPRDQIAAEWTATAGTSSKLLSNYSTTNTKLFNTAPSSVKLDLDLDAAGQKAESSSNLEITPETARFITNLPDPLKSHPVSMLNLLAFNPGKHGDYVKYGQEFSARVGSRYGGHVKIVGKVTSSGAEGTEQEGWDEIAYVHYPSIVNFAAMAGDKDYQDVNHKYRLGALKDTFIICTVEVGLDGEPIGLKRKEGEAKL
ncbi:hypothetical protein GGS20DRAFT_554498 [Poronia punctata]|nr:hypothetical protein GGS20DRAFT_554498 [Poronia punctata]